jgi:hypothetical protein
MVFNPRLVSYIYIFRCTFIGTENWQNSINQQGWAYFESKIRTTGYVRALLTAYTLYSLQAATMNWKTLFSTILLGCGIQHVSAVPNVTVVPIKVGCAAFPNWDPATDTTYPFSIQATSTDNTTIEGWGARTEYSRGPDQIRWGAMAIVPENDMAKTAVRCANGSLQGYVPTGVGQTTWENLTIAHYPYDAELMYLIPDGLPVETYALYQGTTRIPGLFLGNGGVATWGFKYYGADSSCCGIPFFLPRLLGPNSQDPTTGAPLEDGEFKGFFKVGGS